MKRLLFVLASGFLINSCGKGPCSETSNVSSSSVIISFIDKQTGKYVYTETNPLFSIDSLKVYDEFGNALSLLYALNTIPGTNSKYYSVAARPIYNQQKDQNSFYNELCRNFLIKYKYNDTDTLKACFKSRQVDCNSDFETLKLSYRDTLINTTTNNTVAIINIYKN